MPILRTLHRPLCAVLLWLSVCAAPAAAQEAAVQGRVLDAVAGTPVGDAALALRGKPAAFGAMHASSDSAGAYSFSRLERGRYRLTVERFGYEPATLDITLDRDAPLVVDVLLQPAPFPIHALALRGLRAGGATLMQTASRRNGASARIAAERARQRRFLSTDTRQLGPADLREANTPAEDDVFRALQSVPGVARRDDFTADLWTRGAPAGQTVVSFDGVPVVGPLHALGILSGVNSDMLAAATFQRGVAGAWSQGGGAAVIDLESRSPANAPRSTLFSLSPLSARFTTDGILSDRVGWAVGVRRSHVDLLSALADGLMPGDGTLRYAFADLTARADLVLTGNSRIETSVFVQDDRVFGDVADMAPGNEGAWGTRVGRATFVTALPGLSVRSTFGVSDFGATVRTTARGADVPLHAPTRNHFRTLLWETRLDAGDATSLGISARQERHRYNGPDIDPASLLTADALARRGVFELTPIVFEIARARRIQQNEVTRVAVWGEQRARLAGIDVQAGARVEGGDAVVASHLRVAPRLLARYALSGLPLTLSAAVGRSYQYTQAVARTDVLRSGLRVSEVLVQADEQTPALRSDVVTVGAELWHDEVWLLGATGWWRGGRGIVLPAANAAPLDRPRPAVHARGAARGLELSVRRLEGRLHGFANYSLSRSRHLVGRTAFDAAEDRRHVANVALIADLDRAWQLGGSFRYESGAPYTRLTLVSTPCSAGADCDGTPVLIGAPGGQRGPSYASLDLSAEWTHDAEDWSLAIYGQLRNVLGRANAVTYHSSCVCVADDDGRAWLGDRFDAGLPRLPVLGLRARF